MILITPEIIHVMTRYFLFIIRNEITLANQLHSYEYNCLIIQNLILLLSTMVPTKLYKLWVCPVINPTLIILNR